MRPPESVLWEAAVQGFSYPVGVAETEDLAFGPVDSFQPIGAGVGEP